MKFRFLLFNKAYIISFIICILVGLIIFSYFIWYVVSISKSNIQVNNNIPTCAPTVTPTVTASSNSKPILQNSGTVPYSRNFKNTNFENLKKTNPDIIGWIKINETNINYPVVQTDNNEFYLNHTFFKTHNIPGCIFMDCRNTANPLNQNTIIYGHGELLDNSMFSSLSNVFKNNWLENIENQTFIFNTEFQNMNWQIFSAYKTEPSTSYLKKDFDSQEQFLEFIENVTEKSIYDFYTPVISDDKIITLSTCKGNKRLVVHAKLVK